MNHHFSHGHFIHLPSSRRTQNAERRTQSQGIGRARTKSVFKTFHSPLCINRFTTSPQETNFHFSFAPKNKPKLKPKPRTQKTVKSTADCVRFHFPSHPSTVLRVGNVTQVVYLDLGSGRKWCVMYAIRETPVVVNAKANVLLME